MSVDLAQTRWPTLQKGIMAVVLGTLIASCAAEPPLIPPTELRPISDARTLDRLWSMDAGEARRGRFLPYVSGNRVFVAGASGQVQRLDRRTGKTVWERDLDGRLASGVSGDGRRLYVSSSDGVVFALDAESGETLWSANASSEVLAPVSAGFGAVVVRSADGRIVALDPVDGRERWSVSNETPALTLHGYSRPLILDGGVLVGLDDGRLLALDLANGRAIWETVLSLPSGRSEVERLVDIDADVRVDDAAIYVINYQGKAARLEPGRGQLVWSVDMSSAVGLELFEDTVVLVDDEDVLHGLDKETGQTLWSQKALRGRRLSPPAITAEGEVVVGDLEGYLHVLSANDGKLLGRARISDEGITTRPVVPVDLEGASPSLDVDADASTGSDQGPRKPAVFVQARDGKVAALSTAR